MATEGRIVNDWEKLARDAYRSSTSYIDNNYRKKWDNGIRMFNNMHPKDSKYNSESYRYRSKIFRPKTRSVARKHEATAASAFFSNLDVVSVSPTDMDSPQQAASSFLHKELIQYRLTKTIPWFVTLIGAFQDTIKTGVCVSFQYWKYKSRKTMEERQADYNGIPITVNVPVEEIIEDEPCIELIPVENYRFSPSAKWYDAANTSPYNIIIFPMEIIKIKQRMESEDSAGRKWKKYNDQDIRNSIQNYYDSTESERIQNRQSGRDKLEGPLKDYETAFVHLNIVEKLDGKYVYYTLGPDRLLSEPEPLQEVFLHGKIPICVGFSIIETHNPMPSGLASLGEPLQREVNEIANSRADNVRLVLNKRWFVRRNASIDTDSLMKNVPGGVTMVSNVDSDIKEVTWNDVTNSSYQEQDRLNVDIDELLGNFASSSVMTNRKLNETVGGMQIMAQGANALTEYTIRTFVETWVEPVLRQLILLEQEYETDERIMQIASGKAKLMERFGISEVTDDILRQELHLTINVGMGATDPQTRMQKFVGAIQTYLALAQQLPPDTNINEVRNELFGLAGYKDSMRFFTGQVDPRIVQMTQQMQQMQAQLQQVTQQLELSKTFDAKSRALDKRGMQQDVEDLKLDVREQQLEGGSEIEGQAKMVEATAKARATDLKAEADINATYLKAHADVAKKAKEADIQEKEARWKDNRERHKIAINAEVTREKNRNQPQKRME
jgi:hypothetical protein